MSAMRLFRTPPSTLNMQLNELLLSLNLILTHLIQRPQTEFNINQQLITPTLTEILPHHDAQHLQPLTMRRHRISRDDPTPPSELARQRKFIVCFLHLGVETEGYEGEAVAVLLRHDEEAHLVEGVGEVVGCLGDAFHDGCVAVFA